MSNKNEVNGNKDRDETISLIGSLIYSGYKDHQDFRTRAFNRIRCFLRCVCEGKSPDFVDKKKEETSYSKEYSDKNLPGLIEKMFEQDLLTGSQKTIFLKLLEIAKKTASLENSFKPAMKKFVQSNIGPLWDDYLSYVRGVGEVSATTLFAKIGYCEKFNSVSKLWRYFGLHVVCPKCTEKGMVQVKVGPGEFVEEERTISQVVNGAGVCPKCGKRGIAPRARRGVSLGYSQVLRSFGWNLSQSLLKINSPIYREIYDTEKDRQLSLSFNIGELEKRYGKPYKREDVGLKLGHAHNRALRKMLKIFLQHYYVVGRTLAGCEVSDPFVKAHMNHRDIITWRDVLEANGGDVSVIERKVI